MSSEDISLGFEPSYADRESVPLVAFATAPARSGVSTTPPAPAPPLFPPGGEGNKKDKLAVFAKESPFRSPPLGDAHSLCIKNNWAWVPGPGGNQHEIGALIRHRQRYFVAREIADRANDLCKKVGVKKQKGKASANKTDHQQKIRINVAVLYPGGEIKALLKFLDVDQSRCSIHIYGVRPKLAIGDRVRERIVYAPLPDDIVLHFVVAIDCIHFLTGDHLYGLVCAHIDKNTRFLYNMRPMQVESPGFYSESWLVHEVFDQAADKAGEEEVEDRVAGKRGPKPPKPEPEYGLSMITNVRQGGFGFITDRDGVQVIDYAAGLMDNSYTHPVGVHWLNEVVAAGPGHFEMHLHRAILGQVFVRAVFVHKWCSDKPRLADVANDNVLVSGLVCRAALQSALVRADRTVCENESSVNVLRNAVRLAVDRVLPPFFDKLKDGPLFRARVIGATSSEALALSQLSLPTWMPAPREHPSIAYAKAKYANLTPLGAAAAAHLAQPAKNKADAAARVADALVACVDVVQTSSAAAGASRLWGAVSSVFQAKPVVRLIDSEGLTELSIVRSTLAAAAALWTKARAGIRKGSKIGRFLRRCDDYYGRLLRFLQWPRAASAIHTWVQLHPMVRGVAHGLISAVRGMATAYWEESLKRILPHRWAAPAIGAAIAVYEEACSALEHGRWGALEPAVVRLAAHVLLAVVPFPLAVVVHGLWNGLQHLGRDDIFADLSNHKSFSEYQDDIDYQFGDPYVGLPVPMAAPNLPTMPTGSAIELAGEKLDLAETKLLHEHVNASYEAKTVTDPGRCLAFPNDAAAGLMRPSDHPLILLEVDEQRLDHEHLYVPDSEFIKDAFAELHRAMSACGMSFTPLDPEDLIEYLIESDHTLAWKQEKVSAYVAAAEAPKPGSLFAKKDELLVRKCVDKAKAWCAQNGVLSFVKTRPIGPMAHWQIQDFAWSKPMKKALGDEWLEFPLTEDPAGPQVRYLFVEKPNDLVITQAASLIDECEILVLNHGDDSMTRYRDDLASQRDAVSADLSEREDLQKGIVDTANVMSNRDPEVEALTGEHLQALELGTKSTNEALKELDVKLVRKGGKAAITTRTGEPATALKNGVCIASGHAASAKLFRQRHPGHDFTNAALTKRLYEACVDTAFARLGMDMPMGPGGHIAEMTFLGGGFAATVAATVAPGVVIGDWAWVSLSVVKCAYMPTGVFAGSLDTQIKQWAFICSKSVGGCPAADTFAQLGQGLSSLQQKKALERDTFFTKERRRSTGSYTVTWDAWGLMLSALCNACGFPRLEDIGELLEEFEQKSLTSNPAREFDSSWHPLFIARFGRLPAEPVQAGGGQKA